MSAAWGPFRPEPDRDWPETKAQLRSVRALVGVFCGPAGREARDRLLIAEISVGDPDALAEAAAEFDRLPPLIRRRVLSSFMVSLP